MLSHFIRLTLLCFALYEHAEAARVLKNNALQLRSSPVVLRALRVCVCLCTCALYTVARASMAQSHTTGHGQHNAVDI